MGYFQIVLFMQAEFGPLLIISLTLGKARILVKINTKFYHKTIST